MNHRSPSQATLLAAAVALCAALAMLAFSLVSVPSGARFGLSGWALLGWFAVSAPAVAGIGPLVRRFGKPGNAFLGAMAAGMAARFGLAFGGALLVFFFAPEGTLSAPLNAALAFGVGIVFGYVPMFVFESVWFLRMARLDAARSSGPRMPIQPHPVEGNRC